MINKKKSEGQKGRIIICTSTSLEPPGNTKKQKKNKVKLVKIYKNLYKNLLHQILHIINKFKIYEKGFIKFALNSKKINIYFLILILNFGILTTNTSAFYSEKSVVEGDTENLSKTIQSISLYTPLIDEKTEKISEKNNFTFLNKPEIISTKTRDEIDKENEAKEKEAKKQQLAMNYRNVVARERQETVANSQQIETPAEIKSAPRQGNGYFYGFCTWYVANKRSDIPNNWGNAKSWLGSAQRDGWNTGNMPQTGAVIVTAESWAGHVGYVESVNGNTFTISEMNYKGWAKTSTRTLDINNPIIRGFIY